MARESRYVLADSPPVKVIAESEDHREPDKVYLGALLDLSKHGAKLSSLAIIPTGKSVRLKLSVEELGMEFYVAGEVCWSKQADELSSLLGCAFDMGLPDGLFEHLAAGGRLDRRFDARFDEEIELSVNCESAGECVSATLKNYSRGGFCVLSDQPIVAGGTLNLRVDMPEQLEVRAFTQWQLAVNDGYLIGCSYLNPRDYDQLHRINQIMGYVNPSTENRDEETVTPAT